MFRRRPLRPRWRPAREGMPPAARAAMARLQQGHALLAEGQYDAAARVFAGLADEASVRGIPRAAQWNLQAGRAWILAGDLERGLERLKRGLLQLGPSGRFVPVAARVLHELRGRGFGAQANALEAELRAAFPGLDLAAVPGASLSSGPRPRLPAKCPYCGGSVEPDAVEWFDDQSAACEYCGSVLQVDRAP